MELISEPVKKVVPDWKYVFRREMQLILPDVYLGPFSAATKSQYERLITNGITHIICIRHHLEARFIHPNFPEHFKYLVLEMSDDPCYNIIHHFTGTNAFIECALRNGGKVLVHGNNGISRSASVVIAYAMMKFNTSFSDAYTWVRDRRFCVMPNDGFLQQLKEYEAIYQAELMTANSDRVQTGAPSLKRSFDD